MNGEVTEVVEEYLEAIYKLEGKGKTAKTSELVKWLQVAPGTITNTVERLEKEGLITHVPYKGVKLTRKGRKIALNVIRRHRLSERLLTDLLQVEWSEAHDVACKFEHCLSNDVIKKLEKVLGHPKTCPHGNPIPAKNGSIPEEQSQSLTSLNKREKGIIVKITEEDPDLLRYLEKMKLFPGTLIEVVDKAPFNGPITIRESENRHAISHDIASTIQVKRTK
ncbi:MAG: metal-dependent transcriptional regulator [Candidatus Bathyarchaeia archaeon]